MRENKSTLIDKLRAERDSAAAAHQELHPVIRCIASGREE